MDPAGIVAIALIFGFALGVLVVVVFSAASARGARAMSLVGESVPDGVTSVINALESVGVVVDGSNQVLQASPGAATMGIVNGRRLTSPDLIALVDQARRTGEAQSQNLDFRRSQFDDGMVLKLHARAAPIGGRFILLLAADHTDQHRLDDVRRDFVANVSHELKTPIGAIGLLAEAIDAAADDTERVRLFADRLQVESQRLSRMTQEIIDLSRIQSDDPLENPAVVALAGVVEAAVDRNRVGASARGIHLTVRIIDHVSVLGDESMLTTAVQNLVVNAVQYSPEGSHVGIGVRQQNDIVEVTVTDKGVGIAAEDLERVFERFYRVDPARSRVTGGTGLGLAIVKHIVHSHGGEVTLWSKLGQGSTFTLRLPVAAGPHASKSQAITKETV